MDSPWLANSPSASTTWSKHPEQKRPFSPSSHISRFVHCPQTEQWPSPAYAALLIELFIWHGLSVHLNLWFETLFGSFISEHQVRKHFVCQSALLAYNNENRTRSAGRAKRVVRTSNREFPLSGRSSPIAGPNRKVGFRIQNSQFGWSFTGALAFSYPN
jgi:hypothetical protein